MNMFGRQGFDERGREMKMIEEKAVEEEGKINLNNI